MKDPFTWSFEARRRYVADRPWMALAMLVAGVGGALSAENSLELWLSVGALTAAPFVYWLWPHGAAVKARLGQRVTRLLLGPRDETGGVAGS